jgi:hypothetical protein
VRTIEVKDSTGKVYRMPAEVGKEYHACYRVADLHRVAVVAWREERAGLVIGADPRNIIG